MVETWFVGGGEGGVTLCKRRKKEKETARERTHVHQKMTVRKRTRVPLLGTARKL